MNSGNAANQVRKWTRRRWSFRAHHQLPRDRDERRGHPLHERKPILLNEPGEIEDAPVPRRVRSYSQVDVIRSMNPERPRRHPPTLRLVECRLLLLNESSELGCRRKHRYPDAQPSGKRFLVNPPRKHQLERVAVKQLLELTRERVVLEAAVALVAPNDVVLVEQRLQRRIRNENGRKGLLVRCELAQYRAAVKRPTFGHRQGARFLVLLQVRAYRREAPRPTASLGHAPSKTGRNARGTVQAPSRVLRIHEVDVTWSLHQACEPNARRSTFPARRTSSPPSYKSASVPQMHPLVPGLHAPPASRAAASRNGQPPVETHDTPPRRLQASLRRLGPARPSRCTELASQRTLVHPSVPQRKFSALVQIRQGSADAPLGAGLAGAARFAGRARRIRNDRAHRCERPARRPRNSASSFAIWR